MTDEVKPQGTILIATSLGADSGLALVQGASGDEVHALSGTFGIAGIGSDGKIRLLTADDLGAAGLTQAQIAALVLAGSTPHHLTHETGGVDIVTPTLHAASHELGGADYVTPLEGVITPPQITASTNDYAPTGGSTASVWRISANNAWNLTGISIGQTDGRILLLVNIGTLSIPMMNDATSTAANRFYTPGASSGAFRLAPKQQVLLRYDGTLQRWLFVSQGIGVNSPTASAPLAGLILEPNGIT